MRRAAARGSGVTWIVALATLLFFVVASGGLAAQQVNLTFTTAPQTVAAGVSSGVLTVRLNGTTGPASVDLSSTSTGASFRDAADATTVTSVTIPSGQNSASFRYRDTAAGAPTVTASAKASNKQFSGRVAATQRETIQPAPLAVLTLSPATASVGPGQNQAYTATGQDQYGNSLGDVTASTAFTIAPDGSCQGSSCKGQVVGPHTVTGTNAGKTAQATLTVSLGAVDHVVVTPASSSKPVATNETYAVQAQDANNVNLGDVTAQSTFSIAPEGSCAGSSCNGASPGLHTVTANYGGKTATASLAVTSDCRSSGPSGGAYTLTVCVAPASGSTVTGNQRVTASISISGTDPHTSKVVFYLDGQYLLTDYQTPYTFLLPSANWVDGSHLLEAEVYERDGFVSQHAAVALTFANGVTTPPGRSNGFAPTSGTAPASGQPFVLAAVGDGAGGESGATGVTNLIAGWNPNLFLYLGDVYEKGTDTEFLNWYGPGGGSFFGQFRAITDPTIGNHEYEKGQAPGYFDYWNNPPDYYSVNALPGWHLVSLNSNLDGSVGSPQYQWLSQDLANNTQPCTLVYFHHPLFNIGPEPVPARFTAVWPLLAQYGVDVLLTGHDHDYQRWVPMNGSGTPDPAGPTEFVVGTGGHSLQSFVSSDNRVANSASGAFGALRLDLSAGGASYRYVTVGGSTLDSGSISCNPGSVDSEPPSVPTNLQATTVAQTQISPGVVNLTWNPSTDNVGVTGYAIYRDGQQIATVGTQTNYPDQTVTPETSYTYQVLAVDAQGNQSGQSDPVTVTTPPIAPIFSDGFESGNLSKWTTVVGLHTENTDASSGSYAAEGTATGTELAYAWETLPAPQTSLYYRIRFKVVSMNATSLYLERFRTGSSAASLIGVYVSTTGKLGIRNDVTGTSTTSTSTPVAFGVWHTLQVHVTVADTSSQVETWLDGTQISALTSTQSLGVDPIGRIQLGENASGKSYDVLFDDVAADTVPLP